MSLRNSNVRLYTKLDQAHKKIFGAKDKGRQCVHTLKHSKSTISCTEELLRQRTKMLDFYILN